VHADVALQGFHDATKPPVSVVAIETLKRNSKTRRNLPDDSI